MRTVALAPCLLGALLAACTPAAPDQHAQSHHAAATAGLAIADAWARATPPTATVGAAYFTITNNTDSADVLLSVASPFATHAELHLSIMEGGMARMRPAGEIPIPAGASVKAEPGDLHVMLMDLRQPLVEGSLLPLELTFRTAGKVAVQAQIQPITASGAHDHADH